MLYNGVLKGKFPFYIRQLHLNDLGGVLDVQQEVVSALEDESTLAALAAEEYRYILSGNGSLIGVFVDDQLIAFRATLVPKVDEEHLGLDIGLDEKELSSVIYQEISIVSSLYRGHGLQKLMARVLMKQLEEDQFKYVCTTVAPFNIASLKDKFGQKMEIAALKEKYGGKLRYIFVKDLHGDPKLYEAEQFIPMDNIAAQQRLLGDGWRGTRMMESDGWIVRYQK